LRANAIAIAVPSWSARVLGREHERQERIELRLERERAVVADLFESREELPRVARIFHRRVV
jgi:hypothetical protein